MSADHRRDPRDEAQDGNAPKLAAMVAVVLGLPLPCSACFGATGLFALAGGMLAGAGAWAGGSFGLAAIVTGTVAVGLLVLRGWRHNPCARRIDGT